MSAEAQTIEDEGADDFLAYCRQVNQVLPPGAYAIRLVPKTARLIDPDLPDPYDLAKIPQGKQQGLKFRFVVVEAPDAKHNGREFYADFLLKSAGLDQTRAERGVAGMASWVRAAKISLNSWDLDHLALALEKAAAGRLLKVRLAHWHTRDGAARVYIEAVREIVEASK